MRTALLFGCLVFLVSCQAPPTAPVSPLTGDAPAVSLAEAQVLARNLANQASGQFFLDEWANLGASANSLVTTAQKIRTLPVPGDRKAIVTELANELERDAKELLTAAQAKDVNRTTELLRRINVAVRSFNR